MTLSFLWVQLLSPLSVSVRILKLIAFTSRYWVSGSSSPPVSDPEEELEEEEEDSEDVLAEEELVLEGLLEDVSDEEDVVELGLEVVSEVEGTVLEDMEESLTFVVSDVLSLGCAVVVPVVEEVVPQEMSIGRNRRKGIILFAFILMPYIP